MGKRTERKQARRTRARDEALARGLFDDHCKQSLTTTLKNNEAFYSQGRYRFVLDCIGQVPRG